MTRPGAGRCIIEVMVPAVESFSHQTPESPITELVPEAGQIIKTHLIHHQPNHQSGRILKRGNGTVRGLFPYSYLCLQVD